jgi:hypothetical protein
MGLPWNSDSSDGVYSTIHNGTVGDTHTGIKREPGIINTGEDIDRNELVGKKWTGGTRGDRP